MCKFSTTLYNRQLIQFARIPVEFVVHFIRYQNCMKVIINYTFHGCLVSSFNIFVQLMFTRSQSTMFRPVHRVHFITVSLGWSHFIFQENFSFSTKQSLNQSDLEYNVVYLNLVLSTASSVIFCKIHLQPVAHFTMIHNLFIYFIFKFFFNWSSIPDCGSPILDPNFPNKPRSFAHEDYSFFRPLK